MTLSNILAYLCAVGISERIEILKSHLETTGLHANEYSLMNHMMIESNTREYSEAQIHLLNQYDMELPHSNEMQIVGTQHHSFLVDLTSDFRNLINEHRDSTRGNVSRHTDFSFRTLEFLNREINDRSYLQSRLCWQTRIGISDTEDINIQCEFVLDELNNYFFRQVKHRIRYVIIDEIRYEFESYGFVSEYYFKLPWNGDKREDLTSVDNMNDTQLKMKTMFQLKYLENIYQKMGWEEELVRIRQAMSRELDTVNYDACLSTMDIETIKSYPLTRALELALLKKHLDIGEYSYEFKPLNSDSVRSFDVSIFYEQLDVNPSLGFDNYASKVEYVVSQNSITDHTSFELVIHYPEIEISNVDGGKHTMKNLFTRMYWTSLEGLTKLEGLRTSLTTLEIKAKYVHSHLPKPDGGDEWTYMTNFCEGESEVGFFRQDIHLHDINDEPALDMKVGAFFHVYDTYITNETTEGVPHNRITKIYEGDQARAKKEIFRHTGRSAKRHMKLVVAPLIHMLFTKDLVDVEVDYSTWEYKTKFNRNKFRETVTEEEVFGFFLRQSEAKLQLAKDYGFIVNVNEDGEQLLVHDVNMNDSLRSFRNYVGDFVIEFKGTNYMLEELDTTENSMEESYRYEFHPEFIEAILKQINRILNEKSRSYYRSVTSQSYLHGQTSENEDQRQLRENPSLQLQESSEQRVDQ